MMEKIVTEVMKKKWYTAWKFQINIKKKDILNKDILRKTNFEFWQM